MDGVIDLKQLTELLQGGGGAATVVIVWLAVKLKRAVEQYLASVNATLAALQKAQELQGQKITALESMIKTQPIARPRLPRSGENI